MTMLLGYYVHVMLIYKLLSSVLILRVALIYWDRVMAHDWFHNMIIQFELEQTYIYLSKMLLSTFKILD